jgi:uncharacterized repeat protein (TIGR03837 family)
MKHSNNNRWDIFCKIVDNYGDIGVCWRLSQQLAVEHDLHIRLFIDDMAAAKKIITTLNLAQQNPTTSQTINGVELCPWPILKNSDEANPADVVLETFSCELPDFYIQKMAQQGSIWINLEYLSAESWVSGFHAKPSPQPTLAITKYYFFPGFKEDTGGLIREANLIKKRNLFTKSKVKKAEFWQNIGVKTTLSFIESSIKISLFCYPEADVKGLIESLTTSNHPVSLFIPHNSLMTATIEKLGNVNLENSLKNSKEIELGSLTIHLLPFLSQADYDHLLWVCDLNFVRGEDSWIRAVWAKKPFIWQPYIQTDETHILKLKAFLDLYLNSATSEIKSLIYESQLAWSNANTGATIHISAIINQLPAMRNYAEKATNILALQPDLATKLLIFSENLAKNKV